MSFGKKNLQLFIAYTYVVQSSYARDIKDSKNPALFQNKI